MASRKSGTNSSKDSKPSLPSEFTNPKNQEIDSKVTTDQLTLWMAILKMLSEEKLRKEIEIELTLSKQRLQKHINRFIRDGWIVDIDPAVRKDKFYRITDVGKLQLDRFETSIKTDFLHVIEAGQFGMTINNESLLEQLLNKPEYHFKRSKDGGLRNVETFSGYIDSNYVTIFKGKSTTLHVKLVKVGANTKENAVIKVHVMAKQFQLNLNKKFGFELSEPKQEGRYEIAIRSAMVDRIAASNNYSQTRYNTKYGRSYIVNKSAGDSARLEELKTGKDIDDSQIMKIFEAPDDIQRLQDEIASIKTNNNDVNIQLQKNTNSVRAMASGMAELTSIMRDFMKKFNESVTQDVRKEPDRINDLNKDSEKMYG